jgi:endonuclease/exonuclease/phosphatase family metal-dependent hydrolase
LTALLEQETKRKAEHPADAARVPYLRDRLFAARCQALLPKNAEETNAPFSEEERAELERFAADALELLDSGTFWLSQTPDKPGVRGWDAECNRTVTWGKFRCKKTGKEFAYANTHFDHVGTIARKESSKLILRKLNEIIGSESPYFVTGDFNVNDKSEAYRVMTTGVDDIPGLKDANKVAKVRDIAQPRTFHNFMRIPVERGNIIDFVLVNG